MSNQNNSHLGMWAISLMGVFISFILFGTSFLLEDLVENTLAPFFMLFIIAGAMALLPTIYVYSKVKKQMGAYKVEQLILFTAHLFTFTFMFRAAILTLNARADMNVHTEQFPLSNSPSIRVNDARTEANIQFSVEYAVANTVKSHEQIFELTKLSDLEKVQLEGNINRTRKAKVELHKGLLGFDIIKNVELDFNH